MSIAERIAPWSRRHARLLWMLTAAMLIFGVDSARHLASGIYPEVDFPRIVVVAHAGDAPADVTIATVTRPLEAALATVPGIRRVKSRTIRGVAELSLEFTPTSDMPRALAQVESRTNEARADLPAGAEIVAERLTPTAFPVITFNLTGPGSGADLRDTADLVVRPALTRVAGVGLVEVLGGDEREVSVLLRPAAAAALRLDADRLSHVIGQAATRVTTGHLVERHQTVILEANALPASIDALRGMTLPVGGRPVTLSAVADVREGAADRTRQVSGPGGETVLVSVSRMEGASTPTVVEGVLEAANALAATLPPGMKLSPVYDQASLVDESMRSVRDAIVVGIVLCMIVLGVFLRDVRAGAIAGAAVPLTLGLTFGAMRVLGQTLNLMSLGGMAVAIGLVVDDAVVVVEAITRHLEEGQSPADATRDGVRELFAAVVGTTGTTVIVFLPLALLSGVVGRFFQALALTLSAAVLLSMLVALVLVPLAAEVFLRARPARSASKLEAGYGRLLAFALRRRAAVAIGALALLAAGVVVSQRVPTGFLPTMDEGGFILDYFLPAGTSLADTAATAAKIERILAQVPEVRTWSRRTGAELGPAAATLTSRGDIFVRLVPASARHRDAQAVIEDVRDRVERDVPEARCEYMQILQDVLNDLAGAPHPIEVKLYGPDYARLAIAAREVAKRIGDVPGIEDFYGGIEGASPVLRFDIDTAAAARLGLTSADVSRILDATVRGSIATQVPWLDRRIDVRVRAPDDVRFDPSALLSLPLLPARDDVPATTLAAVVSTAGDAAPSELRREDLRPVVILSGEQGDRDLGSILRELEARLDGFHMPPGYSMELGGSFEQQRATFSDVGRVLELALAAVFVILVAQFRGFRLPLVILLSAPAAVVGALFSLWALGIALNASSLMGIVLLVGLVVKNGILLLEHAEGLHERGEPFSTALVAAGERRLRPILMTTLCTVFGLAPLALALGNGAELQQPLAIAVIGGLALSTAVSLFLLPALASVVTRPTN